MAAIRPCTGTTEMWQSVEDTLILKEREIGVEIDINGHALIRQGDGVNKFFDLPIIVNNARYEEILTLTQGYMNTVNNFSQNMTEATNAANTAASAANAGALACQGILDGHNTMVDTVTNKSCVLSLEDGIITIREA